MVSISEVHKKPLLPEGPQKQKEKKGRVKVKRRRGQPWSTRKEQHCEPASWLTEHSVSDRCCQQTAQAEGPPFAHITLTGRPRHSNPWLRTQRKARLPRNSHVFPSERPILSVGCLSQGLFFSLLFLLLFLLGESPLEVLDNAFLFLLFRSIALSLLTEGT